MKKPIHKGDFNQVAKYIVDLSTGQNNSERLIEDKKKKPSSKKIKKEKK
jgi:hypothetical protein